MRVTIGERLGLVAKASKATPPKHPVEDVEPLRMTPTPTVILSSAPSSSSIPTQPERTVDDGGPARIRGEMVWIKKDVAILEIAGRGSISPDEFASNRRR